MAGSSGRRLGRRPLASFSMSDSDDTGTGTRGRWARFRFSVVGPLLSCPPEHGELADRIEALAKKPWRHPTTGEQVRFSASTIERWFYSAKNHPDNLVALAAEQPEMGEVPSYTTLCRFMKERGLVKRKRRRKRDAQDSAHTARETRSFEVAHVHGLWHTDFHHGRHTASVRRLDLGRGHPLRDPIALPHDLAPDGAGRALGSVVHRPGRSTDRHAIGDAVSARQA